MAWQEVEREIATRQSDPVSFGISARWGAQFSIRESAVVRLGWKKPQTLRLFVDMDAGKIKVEAAEAGGFRAGGIHKGGALLRLGVLAGLRVEKVRNMPVRYVIEGAALIVDIPAQLREGYRAPTIAVSRSGSAPAMQPQTPPAAAVIGGPRKVDVTDKFFNDPKPKPDRFAMASGTRGDK